MKRKYKKNTIFVHRDEPFASYVEILNRMGSEGWETISAWADELGHYVTLQKPVIAKAA
jgi:hypothetical protein